MGKYLEDKELDSVLEAYFNEGKLNRITMGAKIHPHQNLDETLKKHEYPGLLNFANKQKDIDDLKYLRSDANSGLRTIDKIKKAIQEKDEKNKYVKLGITVRDCDLTIKWFKNTYIPAINKRLKELAAQ